MSIPIVTLNDGHKMPFFGLGTYSLKGKEGEEAIKYAISKGYRHIDTAILYGNEKEVGNAVKEKIKDGTVKRGDLFITTKLSTEMHQEDLVHICCEKSLANLGLDYVDLYLIHWPMSFKDTKTPSEIDYVETWRGMEKCKKLGLTRSIGVSNFNSEQIERLISLSEIKPAINQVEVTLNLNQKSLIQFCSKHNIYVTGYSPLGKPGHRPNIKCTLSNPEVLKLSKKYNKKPAQIALRFVLQIGAAPIPKSATESRISENIDIVDFNLTEEEMMTLEKIGTNQRVIPMHEYADAKYFPFSIPF